MFRIEAVESSVEQLPKLQDRIEELEKNVSYLKVLTKPYQVYYIETQADEDKREKSP